MSEQQRHRGQVSAMVGQIVTHQRQFEGMKTEDRQWVINNTSTALDMFVDAVKNRGRSFPNARQIAALKYLIAAAGPYELSYELIKKLLWTLIEHSKGLTREVYITLEAGEEFTRDEVHNLALRESVLHGASGVTHLHQIMVAMRSPLSFSVHYGSYVDGVFSTKGMFAGLPGPHENDPTDMPCRYTFWLSRDLYGRGARESMKEVVVARSEIEAVDLIRAGLYPSIENQEPPYKARPKV